MDEPSSRIEQLRQQAVNARVRAIDTNKGLIEELSQVWRELNQLADHRPDVRKIADVVADDIARLEKVNLAFDTEWLAESGHRR